MPFVRYSRDGTPMWTVALAEAGRLLGADDKRASQYLTPVTWVVLSAFVLADVGLRAQWRHAVDD